MKSKIAMMISGVFLFSCQNQSNNVPTEVLNSFAKEYPDIKEVSWNQDEDDWEASFIKEGQQYEVDFDANGNWQETEIEIPSDQLSPSITEKLDHEYSDYRIKSAEKVNTPDFSGFEVLISNDLHSKEIYISENGVIHKIDIESDETYDD